MQFKGAFTALVTPFKNGKVDEETYRALIERQLEQGIHGLVPCGTTGESATLSHAEHAQVIRICVDQNKGRVPVLAGAGSNNTREAVELNREAKKAGADGALLITPYYNKPTQEGLVEHFRAIAKEVPMPFIVYNVPGRTAVNLLPKTLGKIRKEIPEVVGVKEATGDMKQAAEVLEHCGTDFQLISGDDFTILPLLALGGVGVISVVSNVAPKKTAQLCRAAHDNDWKRARELQADLQPLNRVMFIETNPVPAKTALSLMGLCSAEVRLPLVPLTAASLESLKTTLTAQGILG